MNQILKFGFVFFIFLIIAENPIYPQNNTEQFEIELVITHSTGIWKNDGSIKIYVNQGVGPFNYYLSEKPAPTSSEDFLIVEENKNLSEFNFENLKKGTYYVFVRDSKMKTQCVEAILLNKSKSTQE